MKHGDRKNNIFAFPYNIEHHENFYLGYEYIWWCYGIKGRGHGGI